MMTVSNQVKMAVGNAVSPPRLAGDAKRPIFDPHIFLDPYRDGNFGILRRCHYYLVIG